MVIQARGITGYHHHRPPSSPATIIADRVIADSVCDDPVIADPVQATVIANDSHRKRQSSQTTVILVVR